MSDTQFGYLMQSLDKSSDPVMWFDAAGSPVHANPAFCALVQSPLPEVLAADWARELSSIGGPEAGLAGEPEATVVRLPRSGDSPVSATVYPHICTASGGPSLCCLMFQPAEEFRPLLREEATAAERLARRVSADLGRLVGEEIDEGINEALRLTGQFAGADRCYVFEFDESDHLLECSYEWCAPGVETGANLRHDLFAAEYPWWTSRLQPEGATRVFTLDSLPPEAAAQRKALMDRGIQNLVAAPLAATGPRHAFIGLDWIRPAVSAAFEERLVLLRLVGDAVSNALARRQAEIRLIESRNLSEALNRVNRAAVSTLDRDEILSRTAPECARGLGADAVSVVLRGTGGWELKYASEGLEALLPNLSGFRATPLSNMVVTKKEAVFVEDAESADPERTAWLRSAGFRAACVLPLLVNDEVTGVVGLNFRRPTKFTLLQKEFVGHLATSLSLALEAARLYQREHAGNLRLQSITDSMPVSMWLVDADSLEILWGNPAGVAKLPPPYRDRPFTGVDVGALLPGQDRDRVREVIQAVAATGQSCRDEEVRLHSDGQGESYWDFTVLPVALDWPGRQVLAVGHEVTPLVLSRNRVEELAREAENRALELETEKAKLKAVIESAPEAIVVTDSEGKVHLVNPAAVALEAPVLLGRSVTDKSHALALYDAELRPCDPHSLPVVRSARRGDSGITEDMVLLYGDGRRRDLRASSAPIRDQGGSLVGAVGIYQDVTDIKAAQRERAAVEAMKSDLIASVSHELRTPLAAVKGYSELLLQGPAGPLNDVQASFVRAIAESGARLEWLVDDLLDTSQLESHRFDMHLVPTDLGAIVRQAVVRARGRAQERTISLTLQVEADLPAVMGDARRLGRVCDSLLENAVKFTAEGGRISVEVGRAEAGMLQVAVSDTGRGIAPDDLPLIFSRFFRGRNVTKDGIRGTGLGLYNSRSVIEMHGGTIGVESSLGQGSTFRVRLPWAE